MADPYARVLALITLLTFAALTVGDFQFKAIARATYKEDALAQFFSLFYAATGVVSFLFQVFVTPRLLGRLGVGAGMTVMPGVFGAASLLLPLVPHLGVATVMKFADNGFQYTIHDTTLQALYVPFPAAVKARTRALLDAAIKPLSYGLGGLLLLLLAPRLSVTQLSAVTTGLVVAWLALIPAVKRRYQRALQATLSARGTLALDSEFVLDAAGKKELLSLLSRGDPRGVMLALEQLSEERSPQLTRVLEGLLENTDVGVRVEALRRLELALEPDGARIQLALRDPAPEVRAAALRAYAAATGDEANERLASALSDPSPEVRVAAAVGLLRYGGIDGDIEGGARLAALLASADRDERVEAAQILGALGREAYRPTRRLLEDSDPSVRRAALRACAGVPDPRLVPDLLRLLPDRAVAARAGAALVAIGEPAAPALLRLLSDPATDRRVKLHLPRLLRAIATPATYEALKREIDVADSHLRLRIFAALSRLREALHLPPEPLALVQRLIEREINDEYSKAAAWEKARGELSSPLLAEALEFRWTRAVRRVLRILELRHAPGPLRLVRERLGDPKRKANALEVLDSMLAPSLRPLVMVFLDDTPLGQRIETGAVALPRLLAPAELLRAECAHPNPFVVSVALDVLRRSRPAVGAELATAALAHEDPLVREAAILALLACDPSGARPAIRGLLGDPDPIVARSASLALDNLDATETPMFSTIDRILFLKSTQLFQKVPSEDLAALARVAQVASYHPGETVVREGELGDRLYVLVHGRVEVTVAGQKKASLGPGEAFGEMAVLDASPRSATVTAAEETEVLCIGSEEFYEILHEQVEIAEGVIRMLTRRLRDLLASREAPPG
jgi:HEAT repeat protein